MLIFGALWAVVSLLSFQAGARIGSKYDTMPIRVPIRLDRTGDTRASFTADITATYNIHLDLEKKIPFDDLVAFMGGFRGSPSKVPGPPRPEIRWTVTNVAEADRLSYWHDAYYANDSVGLGLGNFKADKGRRYTVTATVLKPSPAIQVTNPHLQVELPVTATTYIYVARIVAAMGGMLSGGISLSLLGYGLMGWRDFRKMRMQSSI